VDKVRFLVETRRTREIPRALELARGVLPNDRVATTLAICQTVAGNNDESARLFQSAFKMQPDDPVTVCLAAEYYVKVLQLDQAAPLIEKLLDPQTKATPCDVAWANRARGLLKIGSRDQRQVDQALALIDQNLKNSPYSFEDQRAQAVLLSMKPNRRAEAIRALETFSKTGLLSSQDQFLLAKTYQANQDWPRCRVQMLALLHEPRRDLIHLAYFVNLLIDQDDLRQAEQWLSEFKPGDPGQSLVYLDMKARLLKARKRDAELLALLNGYSKDHADQIGPIGNLFERYGYLQEAEQAYRTFAAQNTKEPTRVLALVRLLARQDRVQQALSLCAQAWTTCPPEPVAAASVAILSAEKNITEVQRYQVEAWLEDALERRSSSTQLRLKLATLRNMQQRYDHSESLYRDVWRANPDNVEVLNNLAWLLAFQAGKESEALELVDRAIEIVGSDPTLLDTRAVVSLQSPNPDAALKDLSDALAADSKKLALYFHLARAHPMKKSFAEAGKALRKSEKLGLKEDKIDPFERETYRRLRVELNKS
jgi:cellulose synthase operon protein C